MAGVTLMHVLVLFKEKQQHGKSNPYTPETTKVIGKKKKRRNKKNSFCGEAAAEDIYPRRFVRHFLAADRAKRGRLWGRMTGRTGNRVLMFTLAGLG